MSFILDALKKSENDRQDSAPAEFTTVSSGGESPAAPRWLWVLGGLLLLNTIVLAFLLLKPDAPQTVVQLPAPQSAPATSSAPAEPDASTAAAGDESSFSARVAEARRDRPAAPSPPPRTAAAIAPSTAQQTRPPAPVTEQQAFLLPTLTQLRANGSLNLPDMHLDIHVFSAVAEDRFVFINMNKYRELSDTVEGPRVDEITPDGVVLDYQGTTFMLPRE